MNPIDWRQAWRLWSVRVSALGTALFAAIALIPDQLLALWNMMPAELRSHVPAGAGDYVGMILFALVIVVRLIPQKAVGQSVMGDKSGSVKPKAAGVTAAIAAMIAGVIALEGGYSNNRADPGGETNMGITKQVAVANGYTGPIRALPRDVAESIYYDRYLVAPGYAPLIPIDAAVTEELFDTTVNMGATRPSRWFQIAIGEHCGTELLVDGRVGAATIAAYRSCQGRLGARPLCIAMLDSLDARQREEYARLVRVNPQLRTFHRGWVTHRIGNVDRRKCGRAA